MMQTQNPGAPAVFGARTAFSLGFALLLGMMLIAGLCIYDQLQRPALERVEQPTAVSDTHFVPFSPDAPPTVTWKGRTLTGSERVKIRDNRMLRVGMDDSGAFSIYRLVEPPKKPGEKPREAYFLKTGNDEFVECKAKNAE